MDAKLRDEEARRLRNGGGKANVNGINKTHARDRTTRAVPAPEANAELQVNIDRRRLITHANAKSKSEKFPPPHQDGALGYPLESSHYMDPAFDPPEASFSTVFPYQKGGMTAWSGPLINSATAGHPRRKKKSSGNSQMPTNLKQLAGANTTKDKGITQFR
ncbi:hypothetical protein B296_00019306 [Ensete ventricosum]|uniref:Uncharacterized protein n=1 Tax=Ensete ventricosum TaxID=4639 RepID=A0A426YZF7_ENSVE|nr:hypothetical protein B296_00019306 [Ensete ventricosum]